MPVVVIASPKGGAGKSTAAVILATQFAHSGAPVTLLDCDPNKSIMIWAGKGKVPSGITVLGDVTESGIVRAIQHADVDGAIVIVDLEGVASRLVSRAISQADLVIIPMRATTLDAEVGVKALQLVKEEEEALDRSIRYAVVFTMTRAIRSKAHAGLQKSLAEAEVDVIEPALMERAAFSSLFEYGGDLYSMPQQGKHEQAIENAQGFAEAIYRRLVA